MVAPTIEQEQVGGIHEDNEATPADPAIYPPEFGRVPLKTIITKLLTKERTTQRGKVRPLVSKCLLRMPWQAATAKQKREVLSAWALLPDEEKSAVIEDNDRLMHSLEANGALVSSVEDLATTSVRSPSTNNDDRCRMLHALQSNPKLEQDHAANKSIVIVDGDLTFPRCVVRSFVKSFVMIVLNGARPNSGGYITGSAGAASLSS